MPGSDYRDNDGYSLYRVNLNEKQAKGFSCLLIEAPQTFVLKPCNYHLLMIVGNGGGWGVLTIKNFVENVIVKDRGELFPRLV